MRVSAATTVLRIAPGHARSPALTNECLVHRLGAAVRLPEPAAVAADEHCGQPVWAAGGGLAWRRVPVVADRAHPRGVASHAHPAQAPVEAERVADLRDRTEELRERRAVKRLLLPAGAPEHHVVVCEQAHRLGGV